MIKTLKEIAFDFRVKAGYTVAFVLLLISYMITLYGNNQLMKQMDWVKQTNTVIKNLDDLVSGIKDAEIGLRGYVNTKDTSFLVPFKASYAIVDTAFGNLNNDQRIDAVQKKFLATLSTLIKQRYEKLEFVERMFPQSGYVITDTILRSFYWGKAIMDRIRSVAKEMHDHEQRLLDGRTKELGSKYRALNAIITTSLVLALIFVVFGFYTYFREYKARLSAYKRISAYQKELQDHITELDTANKQLVLMRASEKFAATGRIARTIAHEVRNPLTNIDLAVAQIRSELSFGEETAELFDMVNRNSRRINQLMSELLNATRFTELSYELISINDLLDQTLELAKDRLELNRIKTEKNYSDNLPLIAVDPEKIKIAFLNLFVNAIEAMQPGEGLLKIESGIEENKCVVKIADNGAGMTDEELDKLFEPFFTTKTHGNGLGLTNMQNIILNHKATVNVFSEVGKGTVFVIKFDLPLGKVVVGSG